MKTTHQTPRNASLAPDTPERAIQDMMDTIDALRRVMVQETESLERGDAAGFFALQDLREASYARFTNRLSDLQSRREAIRAASPDLRRKLEDSRARFAPYAAEHADRLHRMSRATGRLGALIMEAARDKARRESRPVYTATGNMDSHPRRAVSMGLQETV